MKNKAERNDLLLSLSTQYRRVLSFAHHYSWLIKIAFAKNVLNVWIIILLDMGGVAARVVTIALLAYFLHVMEGSGVLVIPLFNFEKTLGSGSLILLGGTVFILLSCSASAAYASAHKMRRLGRSVHTLLAERMLTNLRGIRNIDGSLDKSRAIKQVMRNALQMGLAAENIIRSFQPMMYVILGVATAFFLEPLLTLAISPIAIVLLPAVYLVSSYINKTARSFYNNNIQQYARNMTQQINEFERSSFSSNLKKRHDSFYGKNESVLRYLDSFDRNQLANDKMMVVTALFQALSFSAAIGIFGYVAITGSRSWGEMLAYVMAIYYVINNIQSLTAYLSNLNRFYPQLIDYIEIDSSVDKAKKHFDLKKMTKVKFQVISAQTINGSMPSVSVSTGSILWLYSVIPLSRFGFHKFVFPLINASDLPVSQWNSADFIGTGVQSAPNVSLIEMLQSVIGSDLGTLSSTMQEYGLETVVAKLPDGMNTVMNEEQWQKIDRAFKSLISLMPLLLSRQPIAFIQHGLFSSLSDEIRDKLVEKFSDKVVFIVVNKTIPRYTNHVDNVVVVQNNQVSGIGELEWFQSAFEDINSKKDTNLSADVEDSSLYEL